MSKVILGNFRKLNKATFLKNVTIRNHEKENIKYKARQDKINTWLDNQEVTLAKWTLVLPKP